MCVHVSVRREGRLRMFMQCLQRLEEGIRTCGAGVKGGSELPSVGAKN